uniref:RRM domain-containing protein n=1 Tax=Anopheles farauti TaxID=69004 RepID=A0A182QE39_9DIPT
MSSESRMQPANRPGWTVFVGNLHGSVRKELLYAMFMQCGYIIDCSVHDNNLDAVYNSGHGHRYGLVTYVSVRSANLAIDRLNGTKVYGMPIYVGATGPFRDSALSKPTNEVYVTTIDEHCTVEMLWEACAEHGPIVRVEYRRHVYGYLNAYVRYAHVAAALSALRTMDGTATSSGLRLHAARACRMQCGGPICPQLFRSLQLARSAGYNVQISGLDPSIDERLLREMFQVFGEVLNTWVGQHGCGAVRFANRDSVKWAVASWHGAYKNGALLSVTVPETNDVDIQIAIFLRQTSHESHPTPIAFNGGGSSPASTNNNDYELYKPPATGDHPDHVHDVLDATGGTKIKLEASDGEGSGEMDGRSRSRSETGSSYGGTVDSQQQSPVGTVGGGGGGGGGGGSGGPETTHHLLRSDDDEGDEDRNMLMDEDGGGGGGGGGGDGVDVHDDSEPDDNKLAPQDQEKMTQAVKKVFTDYKWTPPVAPVR